MQLAVFGATGRVGGEVVAQALAQGHDVRAYVRPASAGRLPPHERLAVHQGELDDVEAVRACVAGVDAVVVAWGARRNTPDQPGIFGRATEAVVAAMSGAGVDRVVAVSGAAVVLPGEPVALGRRLIGCVMRVVARHVADAKAREAEVLRGSGLAWTLVRPPRIVAGGATGREVAALDAPPTTSVTAGDVAAVMLAAAGTDAFARQAPFVGTRG